MIVKANSRETHNLQNSALWGWVLSEGSTTTYFSTDRFRILSQICLSEKHTVCFLSSIAHLLCGWHVLCNTIHWHQAVRSWEVEKSITHHPFLYYFRCAYFYVFHLWLISNWPTYSNILLQYAVFLEAFHCCRVVCCFVVFFSCQPADILIFSVSFSDCILSIKSNCLLDLSLLFSGFIFYILFPFLLVISFFTSICLLPLSELFQCFLHWLRFFMFLLDLISFTEFWFCFDISV